MQIFLHFLHPHNCSQHADFQNTFWFDMLSLTRLDNLYLWARRADTAKRAASPSMNRCLVMWPFTTWLKKCLQFAINNDIPKLHKYLAWASTMSGSRDLSRLKIERLNAIELANHNVQ